MYGIAYLAKCRVSGKLYVGITTHSLRARWTSHIAESRNKSRWLISKAIRKYGPESFELTVLEECDCRESLHAAEMRWIARLGTMKPAGYNMTFGGAGFSGFKRSVEWKAALSERMKGRTFSAETRAKMSAAKKGIPLAAEHAAKCAESRRGKKRSEEFKRKLSNALRGRKQSCEAIQKRSLSRRGVPLGKSAREAISRPVIIDGVQYPGIHAAAMACGVSCQTLSRRIEKGSADYQTLRPIRRRRQRTPEQVEAMRLRSSKPIELGGNQYPSLTSAAEALGLTRQAVSYRLKTGSSGRTRKSA